MIDLHCHLLPGLDDGPATPADTAALLAALGAQGVAVVAATPHVREDHPGVVPAEIAAAVAALDPPAGAPRVVTGAEVGLTRALSLSDAELEACTFAGAGHTLLLETPSGILGPHFEQAVLTVARRGVRVLLAHPERNRSLQREPRRIADLVRAGVLVGISADSLLARARGSRALALALVREELAHVLSSDAHSAGAFRPPHLLEAASELRRACGAVADWMTTDAPAAVLAGEPLPVRPAVPEAAPARAAGFFRRR